MLNMRNLNLISVQSWTYLVEGYFFCNVMVCRRSFEDEQWCNITKTYLYLVLTGAYFKFVYFLFATIKYEIIPCFSVKS